MNPPKPSAGLYAKVTPHAERWVDLVALLDTPFVTRVAFEEAMVRFAEAGFRAIRGSSCVGAPPR